uniref:Uncharacterized protein n=1 Tax=Anguilla anguilla TaxID=7936 RepID=A0A0E9SCJ9_ANGAN
MLSVKSTLCTPFICILSRVELTLHFIINCYCDSIIAQLFSVMQLVSF